MEILEYIHKYKNDVNNLMHEVLVEEFGFKQFSDEILNFQNEEYINGNNKLWLVIDNGQVIGTTGIIEISKDHALLKKIYVKKSYRGKGVAQQLLDKCINYAKEKNYDYVFLETYHRLKRANAFYTKNGFVPYYHGYDKPQGEEIRYRLNLKETS